MSKPVKKSRSQIQPIQLGSDLGIDHTPTLQAQLLERLDQADPVQLEAGEVARIHTAALQLFCLFCRDRRGAGLGVEFLKPSDSLRKAAALLGATTLLQLSQVRA